MAVLFNFRPDWEQGFSVQHSFATEIIVSRLKREQRIATRQLPRKTVEFDVKLSRGDLTDFRGLLYQNQQGRFWLPDWTRWVQITDAVLTGADTLQVSGTPAWMIPSQRLYLAHGAQAVLVGIDAIGLGEVLISGTMAQDFPAGTRAYLVYDCTVDQKLSSRSQTNTVGQVSMAFNVKPGSIEEDVGIPAVEFNGRELFLTKPNWSSPPSVEIEGFMETVDFGIGVTDEFAPVAFNRRTVQSSFSFRDSASAEEFYRFFLRQKGQRGEFYMPTGEPDLSTSIGAAVGTSGLDVPGLDTFSRYAGSTVYAAVIAFFRDGSYQANRITGITVSGSNSRVAVLTPWAQAVNDTTVRQVCFLPVWRFATDDLTLEWLTNTVSQCQTSFTTLEDL